MQQEYNYNIHDSICQIINALIQIIASLKNFLKEKFVEPNALYIHLSDIYINNKEKLKSISSKMQDISYKDILTQKNMNLSEVMVLYFLKLSSQITTELSNKVLFETKLKEVRNCIANRLRYEVSKIKGAYILNISLTTNISIEQACKNANISFNNDITNAIAQYNGDKYFSQKIVKKDNEHYFVSIIDENKINLNNLSDSTRAILFMYCWPLFFYKSNLSIEFISKQVEIISQLTNQYKQLTYIPFDKQCELLVKCYLLSCIDLNENDIPTTCWINMMCDPVRSKLTNTEVFITENKMLFTPNNDSYMQLVLSQYDVSSLEELIKKDDGLDQTYSYFWLLHNNNAIQKLKLNLERVLS